jgi:hypothetical protein
LSRLTKSAFGLTRSADEAFDRQVALVRASKAALVAFLIGFAFSGAASRFIDRLDIIVKEANVLGTAYLRADTIAEPQRGELKAALKEYTADRVALLSREGRDQIEPLLAKASGLHARMWRSAIKATQDNASLMAVVLPPINEVIDLHSAHLREANVMASAAANIEPLIATGRQPHHPSWRERFAAPPPQNLRRLAKIVGRPPPESLPPPQADRNRDQLQSCTGPPKAERRRVPLLRLAAFCNKIGPIRTCQDSGTVCGVGGRANTCYTNLQSP